MSGRSFQYQVGDTVQLRDTGSVGVVSGCSYDEWLKTNVYQIVPLTPDEITGEENSITSVSFNAAVEAVRRQKDDELKVDREIEGKWFKMWFQDRKNVLETMKKNLSADLDAGYDPKGASISAQKQCIELFIAEFHKDMDEIKNKTRAQVEHWCYYDLMKRGVIE